MLLGSYSHIATTVCSHRLFIRAVQQTVQNQHGDVFSPKVDSNYITIGIFFNSCKSLNIQQTAGISTAFTLLVDKLVELDCVAGHNSMGVFPLLNTQRVISPFHCRQAEGSWEFGSPPLWPVNRKFPDKTGFINWFILHQFCSKSKQQ